MAKSVLEAIKQGVWDFEPEAIEERRFAATRAMPGTEEKLEVLAARLQEGLPLWHGSDRTEWDDIDHERAGGRPAQRGSGAAARKPR